jgi:hypothetical protein
MVKKLIVAGLLCASLALAQGHGGNKGGGGGDTMGPPRGASASSRFDNIANTLNLNKDQRKTVRGILDDGAKEATPLRDQISKSRVAVGEAVTANKSEEELKQIAKTSSDLTAQLAVLEVKTFAKIFGTLDDTQKKDMKALSRVLQLTNGMYHTKNWNED